MQLFCIFSWREHVDLKFAIRAAQRAVRSASGEPGVIEAEYDGETNARRKLKPDTIPAGDEDSQRGP